MAALDCLIDRSGNHLDVRVDLIEENIITRRKCEQQIPRLQLASAAICCDINRAISINENCHSDEARSS